MTEPDRLRTCGIRTPHRVRDVSPNGLAPILPVRLRPLTEGGTAIAVRISQSAAERWMLSLGG